MNFVSIYRSISLTRGNDKIPCLFTSQKDLAEGRLAGAPFSTICLLSSYAAQVKYKIFSEILKSVR